MFHWNNRVIRKPTGIPDEPYFYEVHEVYYDDDGTIEGWTEDPSTICGSNMAEVIGSAKMIQDDLTRHKVLELVDDKLVEVDE